MRIKEIKMDFGALSGLTDPQLMVLTAGIILDRGQYLHEFGSSGGVIHLYMEPRLGETAKLLFDFPISYSRDTNNQILFSLLRDRSDELPISTELQDSPLKVDFFKSWMLRLSLSSDPPTTQLDDLMKIFIVRETHEQRSI